MAVTSITELENAEGSWDHLWRRTYKRTFRVECNSRRDGPYVIRLATTGGVPWLPRIGAYYYVNASEYDLGAFVQSIDYHKESASANPDHCAWIVTINYGPYDGETFGQNPVAWPAIYWWGAQKYDKPAFMTALGNPVLNSAGDPFKDPIMMDDSRPVLFIERNELVSTFNPLLPIAYKDKINNATWNGFAAYTVKIQSITTNGKPQYDSNSQVYYFTVSYVFEIHPEEWFVPVLDQGFAYLDPPGTSYPAATQNRVEFKDAKGQRVSEPQLLDGDGQPLGIGAEPVFLEFYVYEPVDFTPLLIDLSTMLGR